MGTKKRLLSVLLAIALVLTLLPTTALAEETEDDAPAAFATDADTATNPITVTTEEALRDAVSTDATYDLVILGCSITLTGEPLTISRALTIDGTSAKYAITAASGKNAIDVTSSGVTLSYLTINNTNSVESYAVHATAPDLTVDHCIINAVWRGVNFYPTNGRGAELTVTNTTIQNPNVSDYDTQIQTGERRGISTGGVKAGTVSITSCLIQGYPYSINAVVAPDTTANELRNGEGTVFNVENTTIKGWSALNVWSACTDF